jgi:phage baseplate assembly protein W
MESSVTEIAVSLPFTIGPTGRVMETSDQSKIWQDRVRSVIGTSLGERVMRYSYGSTLYREVFDNQTEIAEKIRGIVFDAFTNHIEVLELEDVTTSFDETAGSMAVTIFYRLPNNELNTLTVNSVVANSDSYAQGTFTLRGKFQPIEGQ